jgi:hypothetical protein
MFFAVSSTDKLQLLQFCYKGVAFLKMIFLWLMLGA